MRVPVRHEGDLQLGANPVGAGHENRLAIAAGLQPEQPAERSDVREHARRERRAGEAANSADSLIAGVDVDARRLVIHAGSELEPFDQRRDARARGRAFRRLPVGGTRRPQRTVPRRSPPRGARSRRAAARYAASRADWSPIASSHASIATGARTATADNAMAAASRRPGVDDCAEPSQLQSWPTVPASSRSHRAP